MGIENDKCAGQFPTSPYISDGTAQRQMQAEAYKVNPASQYVPFKTPRQNNNAFANGRLRKIKAVEDEPLRQELIRAREQGQREGREDMQARVMELEKHNAALTQEFAEYRQLVQTTVRDYIWANYPGYAFANGL